MAGLELDGKLLFKFEDMYWLIGFDSDGFTIFGCMFLGGNGQLTHLARPADLGNTAYSYNCEDVRVAVDSQDAPCGDQIREMRDSLGMQGRRIGTQEDTMGLTLRPLLEIQAALEGWCEPVAAPDYIRELRLVKSLRELDYLHRVGGIIDQVMQPDSSRGAVADRHPE